MRIYYHTFGCKANQYDTERMRQELEERGSLTVRTWSEADVCVVNTCTVTNRADADARRFIRRLGRARPHARVVVAGCSAALRAPELRALREVSEVVPGHDPGLVAQAATRSAPLVQLGDPRTAERAETSKGRSLLKRRHGATRGWLKVPGRVRPAMLVLCHTPRARPEPLPGLPRRWWPRRASSRPRTPSSS